MSDFMTARHRVAIAGLVLDGINGKPIHGAHVEITNKPAAYADRLALINEGREAQGLEPARPDTTRTRADGLFFFLDLPEGSYKLVGFVPKESGLAFAASEAAGKRDPFERQGDKRYGKATFEAKVSYGRGFGKLSVLRLQPTGITGRVVTGGQTAVLMAEVRIKGSGEKTYTDAQGQFTLAGIRPNERLGRTVQIRARGYRDVSLEVLVDAPGTCKKVDDVRLVREGG